ncbi:MAG: spore cortex biosynthesis protein YabQ [Butyrivibrio sp.]|nr:spore cortex biosynthesis protein YabQ [Acetatifactor muris]MCM1561126.1 spore cortex biosynthesis protein YabQ [Butyrivibrio sp.]
MANENEFLLHALLMGIFITFVYDVIRVFRRVIPHNSFFVSLEDLGFWIYCGGSVFLLMYHESNGELRWFAVFGAIGGMLLYRKLVSPLFVKYVSLVLSEILAGLGKVLGFLLRPLKLLIRKAAAGIGCIARRIGRRIRRAVKYRLTYLLKMLKIGLKGS